VAHARRSAPTRSARDVVALLDGSAHSALAVHLAAVEAGASGSPLRLVSAGGVGRSTATVLAGSRCTVLLARAGAVTHDAPLTPPTVRALALKAGTPRDLHLVEVGRGLAAWCEVPLQLLDLRPRRWRRPPGRGDVGSACSSARAAPGFVLVDASVGPTTAGALT